MKRIFLATGLLALLATSGLQAQDSRGRFGITLGGVNGISYNYALGRHFEVDTRAALVLNLGYSTDAKRFQFDGLTPILELAPRYFFKGREEGDVFHRGLYLSLRLEAQMDQWTLFPSKPAYEEYRKDLYTLAMTPTIGWSIPLGEVSALRLGLGLSFYRQKYREGGVSGWRTRQKGEVPVQFELSYTHAL